jgi:hypothetical protein
MSRRIWLAAMLGAVLALPAAAQTGSQESYPTRAIRLIVPFAAGGPSDIVARIMAPRMTASARPARGGGEPPRARAASRAWMPSAKAAPDGYTFGIGSAGALAISPNLGTRHAL